MKRILLSLLLILCLSAELMIPAFAAQTHPAGGVTAAPTEVTAAPTELTEEPTDPTAEPTEATAEPTEPTPEPTEPSEATEPTTASTEPTTAPTEPTAAPTEPTAAPTEPTEPPKPPTATSDAGKAFVREMSGGDQYYAGAESAVNSFIKKYNANLNQQQYDALVDFVLDYDGEVLSKGYKVETVIGSGSYTELQIANAFCSWVKSGDAFSQARLNRRIREIKLFLYGSYDGATDKASFRYVVYNGNGGKISDNTVLCYALNGKYGTLPTASRSGSYFAGWYTATSGGTHLCSSDTVTQNYVVYAQWSSTPVENPNGVVEEDPTPTTDPNEWPPLPELKISEDGIQFIKNQEGFLASPMWDYGQYSVGYGSRYDPSSSPIKISIPITEAEADYLLRYMLKSFETMVDAELAKGTLQHNQAQYDALISFAYNLGQQWISSKYQTYRYILHGGCTEMEFVNSVGSWCSAGGSVMSGLCRRRMDEANLYLHGDYTRWSEAYSCLIFNGNGGTPKDKVEYYLPDTAVGTLPGATRSGYHLTDWYTAASGGEPFTAESKSPSSGTTTLYAHWAEGDPPYEPTEPTDPDDWPEETDGRFSDVSTDSWYYVPVMEAVEAGLFGGVSETEFAPDAPMTRAMLVTVLFRLDGEQTAANHAPFSDLPRGEWYSEAVDWAYENGVVNGISEDYFGLNENVTRQQLTAMLFRYAAYKGYDTAGRADLDAFSDEEEVADYARDAFRWAVDATIVGGDNGLLLPEGNATRAQCAKMMIVFLKQYQ